MTVSLKHTFQSAKTDSADVTIVQPSNWNEEHELTLATNKLLGRATAGTGAAEELSIGTALSISGGTLAVTTVPVANGGTGSTTLTANNVLLGNGTSAVQVVAPGASGNVLISNGTTWTSATAASGYPQNIQSANYTLVLGDAGKQIFHPASDANVRTYTIPANSSVAFPIGTVVLFTVENNGTNVKIAITTDTLVFGGGTTGSLFVPPNNTLMAIKVTDTKWMANYLYQTGAASVAESLAISHDNSPFVTAYPWSATGFGTKYANPATLPGGIGYGTAFSPTGDAIAVTTQATPFVTAYPWNGTTGFGVKYTNPAALPVGTAYGVAFSPTNDAIAVATFGSPYINAYPWSSSTGFGVKYANPATLPTGAPALAGNPVAFSPAGNAIAIAHTTTPFVSAYPWTVGSGFGTKYANPATLPNNNGRAVTFSPSGDAVAVTCSVGLYIQVYPWNSATGFGVKYANPATFPAGDGNGVAFSPQGNALAVAHDLTPFVTAYPWSAAGFGTKYADPATLPSGLGYGVAFNSSGSALAVAHSVSPFVTAYPWSAAGFGTKYANPATLPAGAGLSVDFTAF